MQRLQSSPCFYKIMIGSEKSLLVSSFDRQVLRILLSDTHQQSGQALFVFLVPLFPHKLFHVCVKYGPGGAELSPQLTLGMMSDAQDSSIHTNFPRGNLLLKKHPSARWFVDGIDGISNGTRPVNPSCTIKLHST